MIDNNNTEDGDESVDRINRRTLLRLSGLAAIGTPLAIGGAKALSNVEFTFPTSLSQGDTIEFESFTVDYEQLDTNEDVTVTYYIRQVDGDSVVTTTQQIAITNETGTITTNPQQVDVTFGGEYDVMIEVSHPSLPAPIQNLSQQTGTATVTISQPHGTEGSVSLADLDGDGSSSNPYIITTDQELAAMDEDNVAHYKLGIDIDASRTDEWNGGSGWTPISGLYGSLDGAGHIIKGLYINKSAYQENVGLFAELNCPVNNMGLVDVRISANATYVGGLTGFMWDEGAPTGVYVTGTIEQYGDSNGATGGLVGQSYGAGASVVRDCYFTGDITGDNLVALITGYQQDTGSIYTCYGAATMSSGSGSLAFVHNSSSTSDSYYDSDLAGLISGAAIDLPTSDMTGLTYDSFFEADLIDNSNYVAVDGGYPALSWE